MIRTSRAILILAVLAGAPLSCAHNRGGEPSWLSEPNAGYDPDRTLVGVATGPTRDDAVDRAIARIAQQIEVKVNATEQRRTLSSAVMDAGFNDRWFYESSIELGADTTLLGIEVVETARNSSGAYSALAVLDLSRAIGLYDDRIAQQERWLDLFSQQADPNATLWRRFLEADAAMRTAIARDQSAITRSVLAARAGRPEPIRLLAPPRIAAWQALRDQVSLSVVPIGDCPDALIDAAESALAAREIPFEQDHPGELQARIGWQAETERTYDPRWWVCRWRLSVSLYDARRGETINRAEPPEGDAYGLTEEAAIDEAQRQATAHIERAVQAALASPASPLLSRWRDTIDRNTNQSSPKDQAKEPSP